MAAVGDWRTEKLPAGRRPAVNDLLNWNFRSNLDSSVFSGSGIRGVKRLRKIILICLIQLLCQWHVSRTSLETRRREINICFKKPEIIDIVSVYLCSQHPLVQFVNNKNKLILFVAKHNRNYTSLQENMKCSLIIKTFINYTRRILIYKLRQAKKRSSLIYLFFTRVYDVFILVDKRPKH